MHLIIDGHSRSKKKLQDYNLLYKLLNECPSVIGMTKIKPPFVFWYEAPKPEDRGLSGFVIIAESHISIHTFPERKYVTIDIFSCKDFNTKDAIDYMKNKFDLKNIASKAIKRDIRHFDIS